ncbi:methylmalonyl-CoA mutase family protein [Candidatus Uabimicrobium sp. HlEnr_7]|uniref:methylmalonyl-CoA mutase family protein n=1 Tax=Candidatus Uabimicrobium helgolandensis TaxID=3095367 RepID=UPI003557F362
MCSLFSEFPSVSSEEWRNKISQELKERDFSEIISQVDDDITVEPFYQKTSDNFSPFCRSKESMYRSSSWIPFIPVNNNTSITSLLDYGQKNIELIFDDYCGNNGIVIEKDLDFLLQKINLNEANVYFAGNLHAISVLELIKIYKEKYDLNICGSIDNDPIVQLLSRSELCEKEDFLRCKNVVENTLDMPNFLGITIQGQSFQEMGCSYVDELAFSFATAIEYCDQLSNLGLSHEQIISNMQFRFNVSGNYFVEIAKLRAAKLLWANIASQFDLPKSFPVRIHATTSMWNKSLEDRHTNIIRTTIEAMAAVVSGCSALTVYPYDYPDASNMAVRVAKNIHHILKEEAFFDECLNATSGSYYIEYLTNELATRAWSAIQKIEKEGGFCEALRRNYIQERIAAQRKKKQQDILLKKMIFVGVNKYRKDSAAIKKKVVEDTHIEKTIGDLTSAKEVKKSLTTHDYNSVAKSLCFTRSKCAVKVEKISVTMLSEMD